MLDLSDLQPPGDGHLPSWTDPLEASAFCYFINAVQSQLR